jgi:hypothetical protein
VWPAREDPRLSGPSPGSTSHKCGSPICSDDHFSRVPPHFVVVIDAGVNPKAIQEFMGHATIEETFSRYGHLMPGARDQARELVDAYLTAASAS